MIASVAIFPSAFAYLMSCLVGSQLAFLSTPNRAFGRDPGKLPLLAFLEWLDPATVVTLLLVEPDDVAANVVARLHPRFRKKVLALLPERRRESVEYWLDHPQPFPRREQQAAARRFKRALRQAG